ncbi:MAG: hypothetical protein AAGL10_13955 [Pseudomonadota bacterium]
MKTIALAAGLAIAMIATPAVAAEDKAEAKQAALSINTPIEKLMANKAAKAIVNKHMGGDVTQHPAYAQFKAMSLVDVQPWSNGAITDDMIAKIKADLANLG